MGGILNIGPQGQFGGCKAAVRQFFFVSYQIARIIWPFGSSWFGLALTYFTYYLIHSVFWLGYAAGIGNNSCWRNQTVFATCLQCRHGHGVMKVTLRATFDPNLQSTSVKGAELIAVEWRKLCQNGLIESQLTVMCPAWNESISGKKTPWSFRNWCIV